MAGAGARLRALMAAGVMAPGVFDGLSAKLAVRAGARAVYMTGFGVSGALLGKPDIGLVTASEMAERVRALVEVCGDVPLIADGDTGHGGPLNAARLTRAYEDAGAAAIQIEDQVFPKRCGHMDGKQVVPREEAAARIRAATGAKRDGDFMIIARTDARATHDLGEAIARGHDFLEAGADALFIEAPRSEAEMDAVAAAFPGVTLIANMVEDGRTPMQTASALHARGFALAIYPVAALLVAARALEGAYAAMLAEGRLPDTLARMGFAEYNEALDLPRLMADAAALDG